MTSFISSDTSRDITGSERRADPRKALRANAEVLVAGQRFPVRTLDISTSGMGIAAPINPRLNQAFAILIAPPDAPRGTARVEMPVTVAHSILRRADGEFNIGLRFGQLSPAAAAVVKRYLRG